MADIPLTDAPASPAASARLGALFIVAGAASLILLALHPSDAPGSFADLLKAEAAGRLQSAIVHGGMIGVLAAEMVAFAMLAARLGVQQAPVIAGLVLTAAGFACLAASLTLDGLVIPELASRYIAAPPAAMASARPLFVICSALIRFLMPTGLAFQAAATLAWGAALWRSKPPRRLAGGLALAVGALVLAALLATVAMLDGRVVMGGLAGQSLWLIVLGVGLIRAPDERSSPGLAAAHSGAGAIGGTRLGSQPQPR
jgi:hypothetical protein